MKVNIDIAVCEPRDNLNMLENDHDKLWVLDKWYVAKCKVSDTLTALLTAELRQTAERVTPEDS